VTQEWLSTLEYGHEFCAVFFDYHKAFDSVPYRPLFEKLESLDFDVHIPSLLERKTSMNQVEKLAWAARYPHCTT